MLDYRKLEIQLYENSVSRLVPTDQLLDFFCQCGDQFLAPRDDAEMGKLIDRRIRVAVDCDGKGLGTWAFPLSLSVASKGNRISG